MKISVLLLLLLAAAWTGSQGKSFRSSTSPCCSQGMFTREKIHASKIQGYRDTPSDCTHRAVLVELQEGRVCVDPKEKWFQKYLRKQKKQKKPNSTST
ncbi:CCL13 protein, partial [Buphagus erythrorhynchus]|nr:CCL13 protein [Buphagus erythrorhynchus]